MSKPQNMSADVIFMKEGWNNNINNSTGGMGNRAAGAVFFVTYKQEASLILSFLLTWILPMVVFILPGQFLSRRRMNKDFVIA